MGDPLFSKGVGPTVVLIVLIKTLVVFVFLLVGVLFTIWMLRKVMADMQDRIGPNRAGPYGLLQSVADGIKLFFKEDLLPETADRRVFRLAPYLAAVPAFLTFAVVPIGGTVKLFGHRTILQLADPPVGILLVLALSSIAVYGVMLAGWASGSKYPLLGGVRVTAQMLSYEAAMGLATAAVVLSAGSLSTRVIVTEQANWRWNLWQLGIIPFAVFLLAAAAEMRHRPFDLVEADQELVAGFMTEYSSVRFALFYLAEFMGTITMSAVMITLFLGGPLGPDIGFLGGRVSPLWFFVKLVGFLFLFMWIRTTVPRFRYDQLMDLGWKRMIPLSLAWLLLIAAMRLGVDEGWNRFEVVAIAVAAGTVAAGALAAAMRVSAARREEQELEATV
ncbi:MAG: NADH-quinone oxidoreductase subunit NuoH [Actinobacteria bacterium]|nr:MAG: NADH-quinone oxidoreductase subunit NuoH [Actinomycetota bacterium]